MKLSGVSHYKNRKYNIFKNIKFHKILKSFTIINEILFMREE